MKKLVKGIVEFRKKVLPDYAEKFKQLALGQSPDVLFIACSDSRVVPNLFASTDPGDLFVIRNVGNLIPCCGPDGHSLADESEAAAIEFAIANLNVKDIIVCGHSNCGAMQALKEGRLKVQAPHLRAWLRHGDDALERYKNEDAHGNSAGENENLRLSQVNVLLQLEHLKSYPLVQQKLKEGKIKLHGWWFELSTAYVYAYEPEVDQFVVIDESEAERILKRIESP